MFRHRCAKTGQHALILSGAAEEPAANPSKWERHRGAERFGFVTLPTQAPPTGVASSCGRVGLRRSASSA